jgi:hypothetical protein
MDPGKTLTNLVFSFIRTIVPAFVTMVMGWLSDNFGVVDQATRDNITTLVYGVAFALYYLIVRLLETYVSPKFSWFLGDFRKGFNTPIYDSTQVEPLPSVPLVPMPMIHPPH